MRGRRWVQAAIGLQFCDSPYTDLGILGASLLAPHPTDT